MAGIPHHVLNRASRRAIIFGTDEDYRTFEALLIQATRRFTIRLLDFTIMPNHFHLIVWPDQDLQLSQYMHWLTMTHTQRWHVARGTTGTGPLYQGRYKAIPVQADRHFYTLARYVQRNPVRKGLVARVEDWRWSSAWHRCNHRNPEFLAKWPLPMPPDWLAIVNEPMNQIDLSGVQEAIANDWPYGDRNWTREMTTTFARKRTIRAQVRQCRKCDRLPTP
jgi:putative transposase